MNKFYKIIHTSSRVLWGNREQRILCESLWMKNNGHQVIIITPADSPLFKTAKQNGLKVYPMTFKSLAGVGEFARLKQIFDLEQPFVVNAHGKGDAKIALKAAQATEVPCRIMSRHNGNRVKNTWPNKKIYKTRSHYVFTTSRDSKNHLRQTFSLPNMQIVSIPDGIEMPNDDIFADNTIQPAARQAMATALGLETDARFIGVFGKTGPENRGQLGKTVDLLKRHFPSYHLVIAGTPENRETPDEKLTSRIHMLPLTEETDAFYYALECCIYFPDLRNFYQGVPREVIKAMACFCPVIGPDAPGLRDVLVDDKTGRIFDPKQADSLPTIINLTLNTPQAAFILAQAARARVEKHHTMDVMGRNVLRIYQVRQIKLDRRFQMIS